MRIDSINLSEGGSVKNLTLASGATFPDNANLGELFYLTTGLVGVYYHNGTDWAHIATGDGAGSGTSADAVLKTDSSIQPIIKLSVGGINQEVLKNNIGSTALSAHHTYTSSGMTVTGYCSTVTSSNVGGNIQLGRSTSGTLGTISAVSESGVQLGAVYFSGYKDASSGFAIGAVIAAYSADAWYSGGPAKSYLTLSTCSGSEREWDPRYTEQMRIANTGAITFGANTSAPSVGYVLKSNGNASPSWQANTFASLTGTPTTLAGYGITDALSVEAISGKADKATTLGGYGITDAYSKTDTNTLLSAKADKATSLAGYGITDAASLTDLAAKANKSTTLGGYGITDAYTKSSTDTLLSVKADKATTLGGYGITDAYTKSAIDAALSAKAASSTTLAGYGITDAHPLHGSTTLDLNAQNMNVSGSILPTVSSSQDLGSPTMRWRKIFVDEAMLSVNTLYLGDTPVMGTMQNTVVIKADPNQSILVKTTGLGTTSLSSEAGVSISSTGMNADVVVQASGVGSKVRFTALDNVELTGAQIILNGPVTTTGATVTGNLTVSGNLNVQGSNTVINSTTVTTKDNIIVVNNGEVGSGVTSVLAGLQIDRGDLTDYQFVFDESDDLFKVGTVGGLYAVATRNYTDNAVVNKADKATTLAGYGITDAYTKTQSDAAFAAKATTLDGYGITDAQPLDADLTAIGALAGTSGILKKTAANTWSLDTSAYLTGNQTISVTGDATGSGTTSIALTLANSGVTVGMYGPFADLGTLGKTALFQVDAKGRIVSANNVDASVTWANVLSKPTTVAGYGITDAVASSTLSNYVAKTGIQSLDGPVAIGDHTYAGTPNAQLHLVGTGPTTGVNFGFLSTLTHRTTNGSYMYNFYSQPDIAASITSGQVHHFKTAAMTIGTGSTVTQQIGFTADAGLTDQASYNYGFYSGINAGSSKINYAFFSNGTAQSFHNGMFTAGTAQAVTGDSQVDGTYVAAIATRSNSNTANSTSNIQMTRYSANAVGAKLKFLKSRGASMGTAVQASSGDVIGEVDFTVPNGTSTNGSIWSDSAKITAVASAAHTTSALATDLVFYTASALAPVERMRINSAGYVSIGGNLSANNFTCGSINAASPVTFSSDATVTGTLYVGAAAAETSLVASVASTSATAIATFATATYRAAKYTIVITQGTAYEMTNVNVLHDGTTAYVSEFGVMLAGTTTDLATFDASISSGTLSLNVTMASATSATLKIVADLIKV